MRAVLLIAVLTLLGSCPATAAEVRLRSSAGCMASVVRIGDVAEVFEQDPRARDALADVTLCPAPAAGGQRVLSQVDVQQLLALSGVDRKAAQVTGSESVTVSNEGVPSTTPSKRPMVAAGVRQTIFESDDAQSKAKNIPAARPQLLPVPESKKRAATPLVERGMPVTVTAQTGGVRVTTSGKAIQPGAMGESIGVELADSKQRILARVSGPQAVEVTQ